jgi:class 3 adenylate cyclase
MPQRAGKTVSDAPGGHRLPAVGPPEIRYARNGDVSIAYSVSESLHPDPVDLVFVTGFTSHLEVAAESPLVRSFFDRLTTFARVISWDKREQGLSDRLGQPPTLEQGMDDLRAVVDAAGCQRAALFGISEGGPLSVLFAASFPERVTHLILYGTYARITQADDFPAGVPRALMEQWLEGVVSDWGGPVGIGLFAPSMASDQEFASWWAHLLRSGTSPRSALELMRMYLDLDVRSALPAITAPTMIIHRAEDRLVRAPLSRALADGIPHARYVELPGEDHLVFTGDQDAILDEVEEFVTGTWAERAPERVLATVLFTDIVDSTAQAAASGDRDWRRLLERHDELVRRQLTRFRGQEVKHTGDGFLASFDGPGRAVQCAAAIADQVRGLGLEVRAGVHTGECEFRDGDLAGMAVHIGARVGAAAGPGEVLVSSTVKDLVVGSGLTFEDRGVARLKGVPDEWRLYALTEDR